MLNFDIPMKKTETYTNIPSFMLNCLVPWLDKNNVEYTVLNGEEIPAEFPQTYTFNGRTSAMYVSCIKSHMDSSVLVQTAEAMLLMDKNDI